MPVRPWRRVFLLPLALASLAATGAPAVHAATFAIVNNDGAGEGFNDPNPATPVGGNTGTTIGAQRLIAFQFAANIWGALLASPVTIQVRAEFDPLTCNATSAVLGSAGPAGAFRDFTGAPVAGTWYASALANADFGGDLDPGSADINATFSSTIGSLGCLTTSGWYYGLDGNVPLGKIDLVSVLIHELGHGLGFLSFVDLRSGSKMMGVNDAFMLDLENHGASPPDYPSMSNAQRVAASTATGNLHWIGPNVRAASALLSAGKVGDHVRMFAPNPQQPGSSVSHWDTALTPDQIMEPIYTGAHHSPSLELALFKDIGWPIIGPHQHAAVNDLLANLGSLGLFERLNNGQWKMIDARSPSIMAVGDLNATGQDDTIAVFGKRAYVRYDDKGAWMALPKGLPVRVAAGDLDGDGKADIVADFGASGLYVRANDSGPWQRLIKATARGVAVGDLDGDGRDDVVAVFANGTFVRYDNAGPFVQISANRLRDMAIGDVDNDGKGDLVGDIAGTGTFMFRDNAGPLVRLTSLVANGLALGDLNRDGKDDIVAVFKSGTFVLYDGTGAWVRLSPQPLQHLVVLDLDGNGKADVVGDLLHLGIYAFKNNAGPWVQLRSTPSQGLVPAGFN